MDGAVPVSSERDGQWMQQVAWQQAILDALDLVILTTDLQGFITTCNAGTTRLLGYSADTLVGRHTPLFMHDAEEVGERARILSRELGHPVEAGFEVFIATVSADRPYEEDWTLIRQDGSRLPVHLTVSVITDDVSRAVGYAFVSRDISRRRAAEQALQESEQRFRAFMDSSPAVAFLKDDRGRYIYMNKSWESMFRKTAESSYGLTDEQLWPPAVARMLCDHDREVLSRDCPVHMIEAMPTPDGAGSEWLTIKFPIDQGEGRRLLGGIAIDITDQRRVEQALRESESRLALVLEGSDLGIWDWHVPTGTVIVNPRWAEMLGYRQDEVPSHISAWETLLHPDDKDRVMEVLNTHLRGETPFYEAEQRLRHRSGEWVWILDRGKVIERDADGNPVRACGTHLDITERKRQESRLAAQQRALEAANVHLESLARTDALTELTNRRAFDRYLARALENAAIRNSPLSLALLDVDHFKDYNDTFGHLAGDEVLRRLADILRSQVRTADMVARFGGEEFMLILPDTDSAGARGLAERFREAIEAGNWPHHPVTASFGVATLSPDQPPMVAEALIAQADRALYHSKREGRNRVTHADDLTGSV